MPQIDDLDPSTPLGSDPISQGDDQIRNIKQTLVDSFPVDGMPMATTYGVVAGDGTITSGVGFTVVKLAGNGAYELTFTVSASGVDNQVLVATGLGINLFTDFTGLLVAATAVNVLTVNTGSAKTGVGADLAFNFTRIAF